MKAEGRAVESGERETGKPPDTAAVCEAASRALRARQSCLAVKRPRARQQTAAAEKMIIFVRDRVEAHRGFFVTW